MENTNELQNSNTNENMETTNEVTIDVNVDEVKVDDVNVDEVKVDDVNVDEVKVETNDVSDTAITSEIPTIEVVIIEEVSTVVPTIEVAITEEVSSEDTATEETATETVRVKKEPFNPMANYKDMPINKEALAEQNKLFDVIKAEVEKLIESNNISEDFKSARKSIIELKEKILALFLISKVEKDLLIDKLQESFLILNSKQDELKKGLDEVYSKNLEGFKVIYDEVIEFVKNVKEFKLGREKLIDLQKQLKTAQLKRDIKDKLFAEIQEFFEGLNKKQEEFREKFNKESSENLDKILPRISVVLNEVKEAVIFKDARQKLIDLQNELKGVRVLREKKDELFGQIREAFNELNVRQDEERKSFDAEADKNYEQIKPAVDEAVEFVSTNVEPTIAREKLIQTQAMLKDLTLRRTQRDELYGALRTAFESFNGGETVDKEQFEKEADVNYSNLEIKVSEAITNVEYSNDFKDIREGLIAVQDEIKILRLKKDQRNELFKRIRKAFEIFDDKRNEFMDKRRADKGDKLSQILSNLKERLQKLNEYETEDKGQLSELENKLNENPNDENLISQKNSINEKINERVGKISDIQSRIESITIELAEKKA